jgi:hypothetical protein
MKRYLTVILSLTIVTALVLQFLNSCNDKYQEEPVLFTFQVPDSNLTATTAKLTGQIQILGSQQITGYGIEVYKGDVTSIPIVKKRTTQATVDTFTFLFDTLKPSTLYYYWAFATVNTTNVHSKYPEHFTTKSVK